MIRDGKKVRGPRLALAVPDELIVQTLSQFAPTFKNLSFKVHSDLAASEPVQMDADIFEMVLVNLLSNAEKYAAEGKYVAVTSRLDAQNLIVTVTDRGPGIGRRDRDQVFKAFARLDDSISAPSGTGIGLAIARRAAVRHGGELNLISPDDDQSGACFQLRIPIPRSESAPNIG